MPVKLIAYLLEWYGEFADRRTRHVTKGRRFIANSRTDDSGLTSGGEFYGWYCGIWVDVESEDEVLIILEMNIPKSLAVDATLTKLEVVRGFQSARFRIRPETLSLLYRLADQIGEIVAPGLRYPEPTYKYMCPTTAASLKRLANYLSRFWNPQ